VISEEIGTSAPATVPMAGSRPVPENPLPPRAQRALTFGLMLSALRCTVQYVVLPFVLPWVGVATSISLWVTLVLGGIAIASLTRNVRYLWRLRHARRWSYLAFAGIVATSLVLFMAIDLHHILGS
jgi:ABC-type iron transport system FetAB permease component